MAKNQDYELRLKMKAEFEQAQRELRRAQGQLQGLVGTVNTTNLRAQVLGRTMTGAVAGITAAGVAAAAVLGKYVANTIEAEKVQAQLAAGVKDTAGAAGRSLDALNAQADKLQGLTVFDDEAIGQAQAMLLTFTQIRGVNFDRTIEAATDLATKMGTTVADAAKVLGKALSEPEKGLTQLARSGVTFTEAQKEQIKGMLEAGEIARAQGVILDALSGKMGTAAEAARDTLGGALKGLQNAFDNLLEGDAGDAGVVGVRDAIEGLTDTLESPDTKAGVDAMIGHLLRLANFAIEAAAAVGGLTVAFKDAVSADGDKSRQGLLAKRAAIEDDLGDFNATGMGRLRRFNLALGGRSGMAFQGEDAMRAALLDIDRQLGERDAATAKARSDALAEAGVEAAFSRFNNPAPEGEGVAKPGKAKKGSTTDPDAAIKRRIASLTEEATLLGQVAAGEDKASEAQKARYAITEGEFKNAPQALKDALLAQAERLDATRADIEAEKERAEKLEDTREAFADLREELRTPAETALAEATAQVETLNAAIAAGIEGAATFRDEALAKIAGGLAEDQPDFAGLAPEVGGAYGELSKLDEAAAKEQTWYTESLARLDAFRAAHADATTAANAEAERIEAQHQARMGAIQDARQQAALSIASDFFGQLATLQRSENSKIAAIGKAAAIAQALINTYQSATAAYAAMAAIPVVGPALGVAAAAAAVAAGLANVAQIRSQSTGYASGGYTGAGGKFEPAGIVHKGEGVLSQEDLRAMGGPAAFNAFRASLHGRGGYAWTGYADGGMVGPPRRGGGSAPAWDRYPQGGLPTPTATLKQNQFLFIDKEQLVRAVFESPDAETQILRISAENPTALGAR